MHIFRLTSGKDLKLEIVKYCKDNNIKAGVVCTCVGCLEEVNIRLAGGKAFYHNVSDYEIVSVMGTIADNGVHIHISLADSKGKVIGGHLSEGCLVNTTAEIGIIEVDDYNLTRIEDKTTGYRELYVEKI